MRWAHGRCATTGVSQSQKSASRPRMSTVEIKRCRERLETMLSHTPVEDAGKRIPIEASLDASAHTVAAIPRSDRGNS